MDKLLLKIADWHNKLMRKKNKINDENYSIKDYIFRTNLYNIIVSILFCVVGSFIGCFFEMSTLFLVFNVLRDKSNGIHSYGNLNFCVITSLIIFLLGCFFCNLNFPYQIISPFAIIYTFIKTPYINEGYDEEIEEKEILKFDYIILAILFWFLSFSNLDYKIKNAINISIILDAIFMSKKIAKIFFKVRKIFYKL